MDKNKKRRIVISILVLIVGIIFSLFFSTIIHKVLSTKQFSNVSMPEIKEIFGSLKESKQHLKLFLSFMALVFLSSIGLYFSSDGGYKSELQMITPVIYTPVRAGQNQHGSARWLTDKEKETAFESFYIDPTDNYIRELIKLGYEDLKGSDGNE